MVYKDPLYFSILRRYFYYTRLSFMWVMYNPELHIYELLYEMLHRSNRARCKERWSQSNISIYILMMQFPICKISLLV